MLENSLPKIHECLASFGTKECCVRNCCCYNVSSPGHRTRTEQSATGVHHIQSILGKVNLPNPLLSLGYCQSRCKLQGSGGSVWLQPLQGESSPIFKNSNIVTLHESCRDQLIGKMPVDGFGVFALIFLMNCRILKGVRGALHEELSDFLEIRGTWSIYTRRS